MTVSGTAGDVLTGVSLGSGSYTMTDSKSTKVVTRPEGPLDGRLAQHPLKPAAQACSGRSAGLEDGCHE